jgi:solute carrier family 35 protein E3
VRVRVRVSDSNVNSQVVGHVKTCFILIGGYLFFQTTANVSTTQLAKNIFGVGVAMLGVFAYTYFKLKNL